MGRSACFLSFVGATVNSRSRERFRRHPFAEWIVLYTIIRKQLCLPERRLQLQSWGRRRWPQRTPTLSAQACQWPRYLSHLNAVTISLDLAPTDSFVWSSPRIAAVKLLGCVDIHGTLSPIPHQACVSNVMLHNATT